MKAARIVAVGLLAGAALWIGSGHFLPHGESKAALQSLPTEKKRFRVAVEEVEPVPHVRRLILSGRTEADRKIMAVARTTGVVTELNVRRGSSVNKGDVIAVLSDEAREAQVAQARAQVAQKKAEWQARSVLIERGSLPKLDLAGLEFQTKSAEAGLANAEAERARGVVLAPWSGTVNEVPTELGQALSPGKEVAQIVSLDPILAVVEVSERSLADVKIGRAAEVRLINGPQAEGKVRFISKVASPVTRTYRVEVEIPNTDRSIPDGITVEAKIPLTEANATKVPRSALTFSSGGNLGVRVVDAMGKVSFMPVTITEDLQQSVFVGGLSERTRLIVQGQDFVREGQIVEPVPASMIKEALKN